MAVAGGVFDGVFLCCPFSPLDVLGEIWDLIESVSEGFLTCSCFFILYSLQRKIEGHAVEKSVLIWKDQREFLCAII